MSFNLARKLPEIRLLQSKTRLENSDYMLVNGVQHFARYFCVCIFYSQNVLSHLKSYISG